MNGEQALLSFAEPRLARACLLGIAGVVVFSEETRSALRAPGARAWIAAALVALAGAALAGPSRHVVFFDEYAHLAIAETLGATGRLCETKLGSTRAPEVCELPPWAGGYHTALALAFGVFGPSEAVAFAFSRAAGAAAVIAVFLAGFSLAGTAAGLLAAVFVAFAPMHARFSAATETGMLSALAVCVAAWALSICRARDALGPRALLACSLGFAVLVRHENAVLVPLVLLALPRPPGRSVSSLPGRLALAGAAALALAAAAAGALHVRYALSGHLRATNAALWPGFAGALLKNLAFWGGAWYFLPLVLAGAWELGRTAPRRWLLWWAAAFLAIYSAFAAPFSSDAAGSRYGLTPLVLLAIAAGAGADALSRHAPPRARLALAAALAILLLRSAAAPTADAALDEAQRRASAGRELLERARDRLPDGAYFVTLAPAYVGALTGMRIALPQFMDEVRAPLLLSKDSSWYVSAAVYPELERGLLARYRFRPLASARAGAPEGPENASIVALEPRGAP